MKPQEMWNTYKQINPSIGDEIDAWASKGCSEAQLMKRLGYLSAFKNLKKLDIKRPNCWEMLV